MVVKVVTDQPGLLRLGLRDLHAAGARRADGDRRVPAPFLIGRRVDEIEDICQSSYVSSYWRNGPVLFNAMSGVDMALWDILGKRAGLPLYQLLGGKVPHGADCYYHASGRDFQEVEDNAPQGHRGRASATSASRWACPGCDLRRGGGGAAGRRSDRPDEPIGRRTRAIWESAPYVRMLPKLFEHLRSKLGDEVELLHDVHERVPPNLAIKLCKALEPYRLFFLEDPFPPEDIAWFGTCASRRAPDRDGRAVQQPSHECLPLISDRLIDFIRIHISQIGGLTPARKVAALCEFFGVRTAWHGPGDVSPVGHAAQLALDLATLQLRHPRRRQLPGRDARGVPRLPGAEGRLHAGRTTRPGWGRPRREAGGEVPPRSATRTRGARRGRTGEASPGLTSTPPPLPPPPKNPLPAPPSPPRCCGVSQGG